MAKFVVITESFDKTVRLVEAEDEDHAKYGGDEIEIQSNHRSNTVVKPFNDGIIEEKDLKTVQITTAA